MIQEYGKILKTEIERTKALINENFKSGSLGEAMKNDALASIDSIEKSIAENDLESVMKLINKLNDSGNK